MKFKSGYGYFPSTVSEMVDDPSDPAGMSFFAFEFLGAMLIFMSWYPHNLRNAYLGDVGFQIPNTPVSWTMFRQFVPPLGMMLVATVTTTPMPQASVLQMFTVGIHLVGAEMLFGGYILVEGLTLGWSPVGRFQPTHIEGVIGCAELKWRRACLCGVIVNYIFFCVIQLLLVLPLRIPVTDRWESDITRCLKRNICQFVD